MLSATGMPQRVTRGHHAILLRLPSPVRCPGLPPGGVRPVRPDLALALVGGTLLGSLALRLYGEKVLEDLALVDLNEMLDLHDPYCVESRARSLSPAWLRLFPLVGKGCLALHREHLIFLQWLPKRTLLIRTQRIRSVEGQPGLGGTHRGVLRVTWSDAEKGQRTASWRVRNLPEWMEILGPRSRAGNG